MEKREVTKATLLIMSLFMLQPFAYGAWLAMIPYFKETLDLTKGELAIALLGMPLAVIPMLRVASGIVAKTGPRRIFAYLLPVQACVVLLPFLAWGVPSLFVALAALGSIVAFFEVAMNTYAGRLEKAENVLIMSRCHGFWALGVALGSFFATQLFGIGPVLAVFIPVAIAAAIGVWSGVNLPRIKGDEDNKNTPQRKFRDMPKVLFLISGFVLAVTLAEGAMSDWAAVYLAERWGGGAEDAGIAVTVFASFLAAGRFIGDYMKRRLGARGVARLTVGLAILGVACLTIPTSIPMTFVGFALLGLGVSIGFPLGISAAASLDDTYEAQNIATMSMIAISGFLIGPPLFGFVADLFSLRVALMCLFPGLILAFWLTRIFPKQESAASRSDSEVTRNQIT